MPKLLQKIIFSFLSFLVLFSALAPNFLIAKAAPSPAPTAAPVGSWYNQSFGEWFGKVYDENTSPGDQIFGERYTAAQVQWVIYGLATFIINIPFAGNQQAQNAIACFVSQSTNIKTCLNGLKGILSSDTKTQPITSNQNQNLLQLVFADRPLSGVSYVKHQLNKFSIVSEVHAQTTPDFGFNALRPVQDMWRASRDVSFGLFVIVAVVFAFMIMFRVKISPQVVISVQSALPKLFIALILVTFSYAIAGFLIDLMYVLMGLLSLVFIPFLTFLNLSPKPTDVFSFLTLGQTFPGLKLGIFGILVTYIPIFTIALILVIFANIGALGVAAAGLGVTILSIFAGGPLLIISIILIAVAIVILIWHSIRIFWMLLKTFANILLLTIFAPLHITAGTFIPSLGFGTWLKSFVSNLLTFVITSALVLLMFGFLIQGTAIAMDSVAGPGNTILDSLVKFIFGSTTIQKSTGQASIYWPPLLGAQEGSAAGTALLFLGVSFVLFILIPKATDMIQSFMSGKPFAYGTAVGEAVVGPITGGIKLVNIATDLGRSWTTRFGTRQAPEKPEAARVQSLKSNS